MTVSYTHLLNGESLPLAGYARGVDFVLADQLIDESAPADSSDDDNVLASDRRHASHTSDVGLKIASRARHAGPVGGVHLDTRSGLPFDDGKCAWRGLREDVGELADRAYRTGAKKKKNGGPH